MNHRLIRIAGALGTLAIQHRGSPLSIEIDNLISSLQLIIMGPPNVCQERPFAAVGNGTCTTMIAKYIAQKLPDGDTVEYANIRELSVRDDGATNPDGSPRRSAQNVPMDQLADTISRLCAPTHPGKNNIVTETYLEVTYFRVDAKPAILIDCIGFVNGLTGAQNTLNGTEVLPRDSHRFQTENENSAIQMIERRESAFRLLIQRQPSFTTPHMSTDSRSIICCTHSVEVDLSHNQGRQLLERNVAYQERALLILTRSDLRRDDSMLSEKLQADRSLYRMGSFAISSVGSGNESDRLPVHLEGHDHQLGLENVKNFLAGRMITDVTWTIRAFLARLSAMIEDLRERENGLLHLERGSPSDEIYELIHRYVESIDQRQSNARPNERPEFRINEIIGTIASNGIRCLKDIQSNYITDPAVLLRLFQGYPATSFTMEVTSLDYTINENVLREADRVAVGIISDLSTALIEAESVVLADKLDGKPRLLEILSPALGRLIQKNSQKAVEFFKDTSYAFVRPRGLPEFSLPIDESNDLRGMVLTLFSGQEIRSPEDDFTRLARSLHTSIASWYTSLPAERQVITSNPPSAMYQTIATASQAAAYYHKVILPGLTHCLNTLTARFFFLFGCPATSMQRNDPCSAQAIKTHLKGILSGDADELSVLLDEGENPLLLARAELESARAVEAGLREVQQMCINPEHVA
ncbi:UNVERIFIED_CONTAM: hypothetical protein HDU68_012407 [Siphonaria sp. JEL0065]|nr:hypothetical protein HDU68_012407 [Siphonaria sp. JEL0065]